jgi:hypothetical protein
MLSSVRAITATIGCFTLSIGTVFATPMYYTFDGTITITGSSSNLEGTMYDLGSSVTYTFLVDFDADGFAQAGGVTYETADQYTSPDSYKDYFFTDYVGGSALQEQYLDWDELNYGRSSNTSGLTNLVYGEVTGGSNIRIGKTKVVQDWIVGDLMSGIQEWGDGTKSGTYYNFDAYLTSISNINPYARVPEPSTIALLGLGLIGIRIAQRNLKTGF